MKKILKRIVVMVIATTLLIMPASTVMAASNPVVISDNGNVSVEFQPDPLYLSPGYGFEVANYADSTRYWNVPAGKQAIFAIFTDEAYTQARVQIYKNDVLIHDQATVATMNSYQYQFPPESTSNNYRIVITALTNMHITSYVHFQI